MTETERKMLYAIHEDMKIVKELHDALLGVPVGSSKDAQPLLEDFRLVVKAYHRSNWFVRLFIWAIPTVAGILVAFDKIKDYFK